MCRHTLESRRTQTDCHTRSTGLSSGICAGIWRHGCRQRRRKVCRPCAMMWGWYDRQASAMHGKGAASSKTRVRIVPLGWNLRCAIRIESIIRRPNLVRGKQRNTAESAGARNSYIKTTSSTGGGGTRPRLARPRHAQSRPHMGEQLPRLGVRVAWAARLGQARELIGQVVCHHHMLRVQLTHALPAVLVMPAARSRKHR